MDREQLRQMLLDSLPPDTVRWDHKLSAAHPRNDGALDLVFQNGARERFDLVVGADGAWSRVRPLVSPARPLYCGVVMVAIGIDDADARHPELARLVGHGMMFALGDGNAMTGHRNSNAHVGVYVGLRVPEDWAKTGGLDTSSSETTRASLAAHFGGWSDSLLRLIYYCGETITPRPLYALPIGHRWENRPGVTLLGGAARLMSPFSGEGANLSMRDAADLASALSGEADWTTAVRGYEATMFARAEEAAVGAQEGVNGVFSEDGLSHVLGFMEQMKEMSHSQEAL